MCLKVGHLYTGFHEVKCSLHLSFHRYEVALFNGFCFQAFDQQVVTHCIYVVKKLKVRVSFHKIIPKNWRLNDNKPVQVTIIKRTMEKRTASFRHPMV